MTEITATVVPLPDSLDPVARVALILNQTGATVVTSGNDLKISCGMCSGRAYRHDTCAYAAAKGLETLGFVADVSPAEAPNSCTERPQA